jgi:hypothetical protein
VTLSYGIVLKYCFGMDDDAVKTYVEDTSGSQKKPADGSKVLPENRVSYLTHENLLQGLLGSGLDSTQNRFEIAMEESLRYAPISEDWVEFPDFLKFFETHVGSSVIKSIFGSEIITQNPQLITDLWEYDKIIMSLAKRIPSFWIPGAYRLRNKLLTTVRAWHKSAQEYHGGPRKEDDSSVERRWGSNMIQERFEMLSNLRNQNTNSVSSTDLGLMWA